MRRIVHAAFDVFEIDGRYVYACSFPCFKTGKMLGSANLIPRKYCDNNAEDAWAYAYASLVMDLVEYVAELEKELGTSIDLSKVDFKFNADRKDIRKLLTEGVFVGMSKAMQMVREAKYLDTYIPRFRSGNKMSIEERTRIEKYYRSVYDADTVQELTPAA